MTNEDKKTRKIKLVISDLHLGKGKALQDGGVNPLEEFLYGDRLVEFLHYYSSAAYENYEIELIINGDFFNFLQVDYRGHFITVMTEGVCLEMLQYMVEGHKEVFRALSRFVADPRRTITYIVGNHDQPMLWPACREYFNAVIGKNIRFKNLVYDFDGVHIEHGHMQEAANRFEPRRFFLKKNLAEPILNLPFGSHFFIDFVLKIKATYPFVDKIRPFSRMVRWSLLNQTWMSVKALVMLIGYFIKAAVANDPTRQVTVKKLISIFLESAIFPDLGDAAKKILTEEDEVHTVIFGHSHVYQYRKYEGDKEYFNTGTWTEVTSLDIHTFGKMTKLTYVIIEYPEVLDVAPRPRGRLKEWRGYHRIEEDVAVS